MASSSSSSGIHSNFSLSSSSSLSSQNLSIQAPDSARMALGNCITRVALVIQQAKLGMLNGNLSKLNCPITEDFPQNPVVTNCGHIFERAAIQRWKDQGQPCALCRTPLTQLTPIHALREFVEDRLPKDPVPTRSNFKGLNQQRAIQYLELAKTCIGEKDYREALELYSKALQYTNSSTDYSAIPELYERLGEPEKAILSRLYLSLYQLQEEQIQEAITTLESCRNILNVSALIIGLKLQFCLSPENIEWAMKEASDQNNPDDSIFIYKQILSLAPDRLDAYQQLILLTEDPKEKRELLLKATDLARKTQQFDLEAKFRFEIGISRREWTASHTIILPPYPQELKDFLAEDCTIWPGKKRSETHIVVPLFPKVALNDAPIPFTLESLDWLDKSSGGPGYRFLWDSIPKNIPAEQEFRYAVMTSDVIPGSRNKPYNSQLGLLPAGYETPGVFDAARAILWENRRSEKRCFNDNPLTYTRCKEIIQGDNLAVGGFTPSGLCVSSNRYDFSAGESMGIAGWRKF